MIALAFRGIAAFFCALVASWLVVCAPTMAQGSGPSDSQYLETSQNQVNVYDGVDAAFDNSSQGTGAVNDTMNETTPSASTSVSAPASAPASAGASELASASGLAGVSGSAGEGEASEPGEGLASLKRLPETGGASPTALSPGILLVVGGLLVYGLGRR